jgi:hypothetical protein
MAKSKLLAFPNANNFVRQWFSRYDQIGLSLEALRLEAVMRDQSHLAAWKIIQSNISIHGEYYYRQARRLHHIALRNTSMPIRLFFDGFWNGFNAFESPLFAIFKLASIGANDIAIVSSPQDADIVIYSCFPPIYPFHETKHCTRVLFLGENVRPSYSSYDFSLSSIYNRFCGRNAYFSIWLYEILESLGAYLQNTKDELSIDEISDDVVENYLKRSRSVSIPWKDRLEEPVFIGTNHEPFRLELMRTMEAFGLSVHIYGSDIRPVENKTELLSRYKLNICPENSYSHGYVTEKLIQAIACGCKVLYWGGLPPSAVALLRDTGNICLDDSGTTHSQIASLSNSNIFLNPVERVRLESYLKKAARIALKHLVIEVKSMLALYR